MGRYHINMRQVLDIEYFPFAANNMCRLLSHHGHLVIAVDAGCIGAHTNGPQVVEVLDSAAVNTRIITDIFIRLFPFFVPAGIIEYERLWLYGNACFFNGFLYIVPGDIAVGRLM